MAAFGWLTGKKVAKRSFTWALAGTDVKQKATARIRTTYTILTHRFIKTPLILDLLMLLKSNFDATPETPVKP